MSKRFTPAVLRVLREAGWFEGRKADTAASSEAYLQEWGFPIHRTAADILREFDGLNCYAKETRSWLKFDVREALMWSDPWEVPAFGWVTGQPLCPVGHGNGGLLLIAGSGEVVWMKDDWLGFVREESFPYALDTHFRADYGRSTWVYIDEEELEQVLKRFRPTDS